MNDISVSKVVLVDRIAASGSLLGMALIERCLDVTTFLLRQLTLLSMLN